MPRSLKKGPYVETKLLNRVRVSQESRSNRVIKTWSRRSTISTPSSFYRPGRPRTSSRG